MSNESTALQILFQRPFEPAFTPRDDGKTALDLPSSYYTDRYKDIVPELSSRFGGDSVQNRVQLIITVLIIKQLNICFFSDIC